MCIIPDFSSRIHDFKVGIDCSPASYPTRSLFEHHLNIQCLDKQGTLIRINIPGVHAPPPYLLSIHLPQEPHQSASISTSHNICASRINTKVKPTMPIYQDFSYLQAEAPFPFQNGSSVPPVRLRLALSFRLLPFKAQTTMMDDYSQQINTVAIPYRIFLGSQYIQTSRVPQNGEEAQSRRT